MHEACAQWHKHYRTSTGHSCNHAPTPSAFLTGFVLISRVASGLVGGSGPLDPDPSGQLRSWTTSFLAVFKFLIRTDLLICGKWRLLDGDVYVAWRYSLFVVAAVDGLVDCNDPDCCRRHVCDDSPYCPTARDPLDILLRKQPPSSTSSFYDRVKFLIDDDSVQSYASRSSFDPRSVSLSLSQRHTEPRLSCFFICRRRT